VQFVVYWLFAFQINKWKNVWHLFRIFSEKVTKKKTVGYDKTDNRVWFRWWLHCMWK